MRTKSNPKAPEIDVLARHYLSRGLSKHPDIAKHVVNIDDIDRMPMLSLLTVAKKMGVDADATISATEQDEDQQFRYSHSYPGFKLEVAAVPEEHGEDGITEGPPYWLRLEDLTKDDILAHRMWDAILDAIDEKCKAEDAVRRKAAAATIPPRPPRGQGRRRH